MESTGIERVDAVFPTIQDIHSVAPPANKGVEDSPILAGHKPDGLASRELLATHITTQRVPGELLERVEVSDSQRLWSLVKNWHQYSRGVGGPWRNRTP